MANEYFTNETLSKTYYFETATRGSDLMFDRAEGSEIQWVSKDKNLTLETVVKKQKNKSMQVARSPFSFSFLCLFFETCIVVVGGVGQK